MNNTDTALVDLHGCLLGDEGAIERLICQYQAGVFRIALSILEDVAEANEATQDTFIAVLANLKSYQERASFKAWIYTIALNTSRSRMRKKKTVARLKKTLEILFRVQLQKTNSPEEAVIQQERDGKLWKAIEKMNEKQRTPLILRYFHELSVAEIAEILRISEGTVHSRLFTAREYLRATLEKEK
jgi:RNA polymerase sigma-70 factor (ECF subfamily)